LTSLALSIALILGSAGTARAAGTLTVSNSPTTQGGTITGDGISCGNDCDQFYANDCEPNPEPPPPQFCFPQVVTITATPNSASGWAFQSWTNCDTPSGNTCDMTMSTSKSVTANYRDVENPRVSLVTPSPGAIVRGNVTLAAGASDNWGVQVVRFLINGADVRFDNSAPYFMSWDSTTIPDSNNVQLGARSVDFAGNQSSVATRTITVDNTPPDATITGGPSGPTAETTPTFEFTSSDATSGVGAIRCRFDGAAFGPCSGAGSHTPASPLPDGPHTFEVMATDRAGNVDIDTRSFTVETTSPPPPPPPVGGGGGGSGGSSGGGSGRGDTDPPDTAITKGPKPKTKRKSTNFEFTSSEPGSSFECNLDGEGFQPCVPPEKVKVKRGKHTFLVRATDRAGNTDPAPASSRWKVKRKKRK
jgi:hypothetical protein